MDSVVFGPYPIRLYPQIALKTNTATHFFLHTALCFAQNFPAPVLICHQMGHLFDTRITPPGLIKHPSELDHPYIGGIDPRNKRVRVVRANVGRKERTFPMKILLLTLLSIKQIVQFRCVTHFIFISQLARQGSQTRRM